MRTVPEGDAAFAGVGMQEIQAVVRIMSFPARARLQAGPRQPFHDLVGFDDNGFHIPGLAVVPAAPQPVLLLPQPDDKDIAGVFVHNHVRVQKTKGHLDAIAPGRSAIPAAAQELRLVPQCQQRAVQGNGKIGLAYAAIAGKYFLYIQQRWSQKHVHGSLSGLTGGGQV